MKAPPQVNRAQKPKIPLKPAPVVRSSNLELEATVIDGRLSPFSTPPSSDESPDLMRHQSGKSQYSVPRRKEGTSTMHERQSYFPAPSNHQSIHPRPYGSDRITSQSGEGVSSRPKESPAAVLTHNDQLDPRPGLPPRRNIAKTSQGLAVSTPMVAKTTRGQHSDVVMEKIPTGSTRALDTSNDAMKSKTDFLPPPKRSSMLKQSDSLTSNNYCTVQPAHSPQVLPAIRSVDNAGKPNLRVTDSEYLPLHITEFPYTSSSNRRAPIPNKGVREIDTHYETRILGMCGPYVCTTGYLTRAWDLSSGEMIMSLGHIEKELRITAMAFKPGVTAEEEGSRLWLGDNYGDIQEVDIPTQKIVCTKSAAHGRREIVKIYRHQNSMWTLDEDGKLYVWSPDEEGLPNLRSLPASYRVPRGHACSLIVKENLWLATGKYVRVFRLGAKSDGKFSVLEHPLVQPGVGEVTSAATISAQLDCIYFGHADGKITIYSTVNYTCLGIVNVSVYRISSLAGVGSYLWAGYNTGMIYVYDTQTQPWITKKDWLAHDHPIADIVSDNSSVWTSGVLRVASIGQDNAIRLWDGLLEDDWLGIHSRSSLIVNTLANKFAENDLRQHDTDYCSFREIKAVVVTWNVGAAGPANVRYEEKESNFFQEILQTHEPPDILIFGFQELIDLEDKRLTASRSFASYSMGQSNHQQRVSLKELKKRIPLSMNT